MIDVAPSQKMAAAWIKASKELGFIFKSPYILMDESKEVQITGFIPQFGGVNGIAILGPHDVDEADDLANELNIFCPSLNSSVYEKFDRYTFIKTLKEWKWNLNIKDAPEWY